MAETEQQVNLTRLAPWMLVVFGATGLMASFAYSTEEFLSLKYPAEQLACNLSPFVGCGPAIDSWQGHLLFGVPNGFVGLSAFSVVLTLGVLMLAGSKFSRWIWQGLQAGVACGAAVVLWFFFQSVFALNHLCPFCMVTWASVLPIAWYTTLHNIQADHIRLAESHRRFGNFAIKHHATVLVGVFLVLVLIVVGHFWAYFGRAF